MNNFIIYIKNKRSLKTPSVNAIILAFWERYFGIIQQMLLCIIIQRDAGPLTGAAFDVENRHVRIGVSQQNTQIDPHVVQLHKAAEMGLEFILLITGTIDLAQLTPITKSKLHGSALQILEDGAFWEKLGVNRGDVDMESVIIVQVTTHITFLGIVDDISCVHQLVDGRCHLVDVDLELMGCDDGDIQIGVVDGISIYLGPELGTSQKHAPGIVGDSNLDVCEGSQMNTEMHGMSPVVLLTIIFVEHIEIGEIGASGADGKIHRGICHEVLASGKHGLLLSSFSHNNTLLFSKKLFDTELEY